MNLIQTTGTIDEIEAEKMIVTLLGNAGVKGKNKPNLADIRKLFRAADKDNSGEIDKAEFGVFILDVMCLALDKNASSSSADTLKEISSKNTNSREDKKQKIAQKLKNMDDLGQVNIAIQ